jgi:hypothetical protein
VSKGMAIIKFCTAVQLRLTVQRNYKFERGQFFEHPRLLPLKHKTILEIWL